MKANNVTKWLVINHQASSLYSIIEEGSFKETNVGREAWESLLHGSSLQPNCNKEGFNLNPWENTRKLTIRIGIAANNENDCKTCDSFIGFGVSYNTCSKTGKKACGNVALCNGNEDVDITAIGYILVQ